MHTSVIYIDKILFHISELQTFSIYHDRWRGRIWYWEGAGLLIWYGLKHLHDCQSFQIDMSVGSSEVDIGGKRRRVFEWWRILAYSNVKMRSSCAGFLKGKKHGVWIRRQPKVHPSRLRSHPENPEQCRLYLLSQDLQVEVGDTSGPFCETVMRSISVGLWVWVWPEGFWKLQTWTLEPLAVSHILLHVFHWFSLKEAKLEKKEEASL